MKAKVELVSPGTETAQVVARPLSEVQREHATHVVEAEVKSVVAQRAMFRVSGRLLCGTHVRSALKLKNRETIRGLVVR